MKNIWRLINTVLVKSDYSNFKQELSVNGGCYWFKTYHDWYVLDSESQKGLKYAFVVFHATSSEFAFDQLTGRFEKNHIDECSIKNTAQKYKTLKYKSDSVDLEDIATISSKEEMQSELNRVIEIS